MHYLRMKLSSICSIYFNTSQQTARKAFGVGQENLRLAGWCRVVYYEVLAKVKDDSVLVCFDRLP